MKHQSISNLIHDNLDANEIKITEISPTDAVNSNVTVYYSSVNRMPHVVEFNNYKCIESYQMFLKVLVRNFEILIEESLENPSYDLKDYRYITKVCLHIQRLKSVFVQIPHSKDNALFYYRTDTNNRTYDIINELFYDKKTCVTNRIRIFQNAQYSALIQISKMIAIFADNMLEKQKTKNSIHESNKPEFSKLKLDISAKSLGTFIHVLRRVGGVFSSYNATLISKAVSNTIKTEINGDISPDYFRNQQYKPSTSDLKALRNYLTKMITFIDHQPHPKLTA